MPIDAELHTNFALPSFSYSKHSLTKPVSDQLPAEYAVGVSQPLSGGLYGACTCRGVSGRGGKEYASYRQKQSVLERCSH